jgi:hypothetical protein
MKPVTIYQLANAGMTLGDILALGRIERSLHRWDELLCGNSQGHIERDEKTGKPFLVLPNIGHRYPVRDRQKGALKRLASIMVRYPYLVSYHQTDPRGCALYVVHVALLTPDNLGEPKRTVEQVYSSGVPIV